MPSPLFNPANITCQGNGTQRSLDVMSELFNHRVLMLNSEVTTATCSQLIADLLVLEYKDPHAPVTLLISSPGGEVHAGLGLIDVMDDIACPVNTVAFGLVASMASVILACGARRRAYPNSQILLHQLMTSTGVAQQSDIDILAAQTSAMRGRLDELLARRCGSTPSSIHELTDRDCWCDAERALELGIIDEVIGTASGTDAAPCPALMQLG